MTREDPILYYLHIEKTGGTTLINILDQHFSDTEIYPEHDFLDGLSDGEADPGSYRFFRGHDPFPAVYEHLGRPTAITILREPCERMISEFEMRRWVPDPRERIRSRLQTVTVHEFLDDPALMLRFGNRMTKLLGHYTRDEDGIFQPDLDRALANLEKFAVVGLTERFDDSLDMILARLGLPAVDTIAKENVSPQETRIRDGFDDAVWSAVREANQLDCVLYERARELFEDAWRRHRPDEPRTWFDARGGLDLDMRRMDAGHGWYPGEAHGSHAFVRWTGPAQTSSVHMSIDPSKSYEVTIDTVGWARQGATLAITANGVPLPVEGARERVGALVPPQRSDLLRLGLTVSAVAKVAPDPRSLGVCISHLAIRET